MKTILKKLTLIGLLAIMLALAACGGASQEDLDKAAQAGAEAALAAQTPEALAPIVVEVEVIMPTPQPTATVASTPDPVETPEPVDVAEEEEVATPTPEATTAPQPTVTPEDEDDTVVTSVLTPTYSLDIDGFDGTITFSGWAPIELSPNGDWYALHTANDTWESVGETWKQASEGCTMPAACNVYGPEGALLADDYDEAKENDSAIWGGSIWHGSPDNTQSSFSLLCPEGSYCDVYALNFGLVEIGPAGNPYITLEIPTCGEHCGQGLLIRNWLSRPGVDLNTTVIISKYGEPGAASWSEYTVDPDDAERFSQSYGTDQAENAHQRNNNGSGPDDNDRFYQWVFDLNDMSLSLMLHTANNGWVKIWTNVVSYGTH